MSKKKLVPRFVAMLIAFIAFALPQIPNLAVAAEEGVTSVIKEVTLMRWGSDRFNEEGPLYFTEFGEKLNIDLEYDYDGEYKIQEGDRLLFELKPNEGCESYIRFANANSHITQLVDEGVKIASLDASNRKSIEIVFEDVKTSFKATIEMPYVADSIKLVKYFTDNPTKDVLDTKYTLYINDKPTDKTVTYRFKKSDLGPNSARFAKTDGLYQQEGEFGAGKMLYNIKVGTTLRHNNEFVIYDTPDINMAFNGDIVVYNSDAYGKLSHRLTSGNYYKQDADKYFH